MTVQVEIAGRAYTVAIQPAGGMAVAGQRLRIALTRSDGADRTDVFEIDARQTELGASFVYLASGRLVEAVVTPEPGGRVLVQFPAHDLEARVSASRARGAVGGSRSDTGEQRILAPMPGRIVRVLVKPGDDVVAKQALVVVEAMKMENELGAPRAGRIREITATEGASVEAGRVLIIID